MIIRGKLQIANTGAPGAPPSGSSALYVDATTKRLSVKNSAGTVVAYAEGLLASVTFSLGGTSLIDLFTVPAGRRLMVTHAIVRDPASSLSAHPISLSLVESEFGFQLLPTMDLSTLDLAPANATGAFAHLQQCVVVGAGATVQASLNAGTDADVAVTLDLFGYLL